MSSKGILGKLSEGLTLRVFVIGLAINLLFLAMFGWNNAIGGPQQNDFVAYTFKWDFRPFPWSMIWVMMVIGLVIYKFARVGKPFTAAELSILFAWMAGGMAWMNGSLLNQYCWGIAASRLVGAWAGYYERFMPPYFTPSLEVWEQSYYAPGAVPWAVWLPVIAFWTALGGSMMIFTFAITLIMRKRWIEIERLPYPYAAIPLEAIKIQDAYLAESGEAHKSKRYIYILLAGFIIGFLWQLPSLIPGGATTLADAGVPPWFWPGGVEWDLYAYPGPWRSVPIFYLESNGPPPLFFLWFIVPLDVLISMAITSVFWLDILLPILMVVNNWSAPAAGLAGTSWWLGNQMWSWGPSAQPFNPGYAFGDVVGFMALGGWSLWFARGYVRKTFRAVLRPGSVPDLEEENEPLSYRYSWLLAITSGVILFIMMLVFMKMPWHGAVIMFICTFLSIHGWNKLRGEAGFVGRTQRETAEIAVPYRFVGFDGWYQGPITAPADTTQEFWSTYTYSTFMFGMGGTTTIQIPTSNFGDSWKVAHETKGTKGAFKGMVIGMILSLLFFIPITIAIMYSKGLMNTGWRSQIWGAAGLQGIAYSPTISQNRPIGTFPGTNISMAYTHLIIGVVVIGLIMMARIRFIWFPLNPVGFVLGSGQWSTDFNAHGGLMGLATIAAVVKYGIIRFLGARFYEEYAGPFALGVISGWILPQLIVFLRDTYLSLIAL